MTAEGQFQAGRSTSELVVDRVDLDLVTLKDLVTLLKRRALFIIACTLISGIAAGAAAFVVPKWYQATVVLSPVANTNTGGMGNSSASQLGGLAALAGLSVGGDSKKSESVAVLASEDLTERYIDQNNLLPLIYKRDWDAQKGTWKKKPPDAPTLWKANQYFKKSIRGIATDSKTGILTLTITWKDPVIAAQWANGLVALTNEFLREKAIAESERNIAYLTDEAAKTNIVEARKAMYTILEGEINKAMIARGSQEFAFKILDPARPSEKASSPIKSLWIVIGLFAGFFVSSFAVFTHGSWK